jgi:pectinesterase
MMRFTVLAAAAMTALGITLAAHNAHAGTKPKMFTVAANGSAAYKSIQAAVNAVANNSKTPVIIFIKPGIYRGLVVVGKRKPAITFLGEDGKTRQTIITYNLNANDKGANGKPIGTFSTQTVWVKANNFSAANISFVNCAGNTGQALAIRVDGDRAIFDHCRFTGWQDTVLTNAHRQYFENCYIAGATDFIFGGATSYFDHCRIHCLGYGFITAARTPQHQKYGYVFNHCKITSESRPGRVVLGRPWRQYADVVFMHTWMPDAIAPRGWITWHHNPIDKKTTRYAEFDNAGPGWSPAQRVPWIKQLTAAQAAGYTVRAVLAGDDHWNPQAIVQRTLLPEILAVSGPSIPHQVFNIAWYHAKGNGRTLDTLAIQRALDICYEDGGGEVVVPAGKFLTGPLKLRSNTNLHLSKGAEILFSNDPADYKRGKSGYGGCLQANNAHDIEITGNGIINGQGRPWWKLVWAEKKAEKKAGKKPVPTPVPIHRPQMIVLNNCRRVLIQGITLENSPSFHLFPQECRDVVIRGITILAPQYSPNTDGIDPSGWNYLITGCHFNEGDDCIAIKAAGKHGWIHLSCENFLITHCLFDHGHGMSVGSVTYGGLRNMTVMDCTFNKTDAGIRLKSNRHRGGPVTDLVYSHLKMNAVKVAVQIVSYYLKIPSHPQLDKAQPITATTPIWRHIYIHDVTAANGKVAGMIIGLPEKRVDDVLFNHVHISAQDGMKIVNANGVDFVHSVIKASHGPDFIIHDSQVQGINP